MCIGPVSLYGGWPEKEFYISIKMTQAYTKSLATDFSNQLNASQLQTNLEQEPLITKLLIGIMMNNDDVDIIYAENLPAAEETALDNIVTNYVYKAPDISNQVLVKEEDIKTGGHFQVKTIHVTAAANETKLHDISWPHDVNILSVSLYSTADMVGDKVSALIAPNTTIGAITADVATTDTTFTVQSSVVQNIRIGYLVTITDLTNTDECGVVTAIDLGAFTITVETAPTNAYLAATPTYIQMTVQMMVQHEMPGFDFVLILGESKIGASHIPANTTVRIKYENSTAAQKDLIACVEYLY